MISFTYWRRAGLFGQNMFWEGKILVKSYFYENTLPIKSRPLDSSCRCDLYMLNAQWLEFPSAKLQQCQKCRSKWKTLIILPKIIVLDRQGTQQQWPESPAVTPPGMRANTRHINSTKGTSLFWWQVTAKHAYTLDPTESKWADLAVQAGCVKPSGKGVRMQLLRRRLFSVIWGRWATKDWALA